MSYTDDVTLGTNQSSVPMSTAVGFKDAENRMAAWLMGRGIARTRTQALYILLGAAVLALGIGAYFIFWPQSVPHPHGLPPPPPGGYQ